MDNIKDSNSTKARLLAKELAEKKQKQNSNKGEGKPNPLAKFKKNRQVIENEQKQIQEDSKDPNKVILIKLSDIIPLIVNGEEMHNRSAISKKDIEELNKFAESIVLSKGEGTLYKTGLMNAITLRISETEEGKYELIAGFRRVEAFKINNEEYIPAIVLENCDDKKARRLRNAENKQRRNVNAYDETYGDLEEIQLYCDYSSMNETEKKIKNIKKVMEIESKILKSLDTTNMSEEEILDNVVVNSKFTKEEHIEARELNEIISNITQKQLTTFVNRLEILNINDIIKEAMLRNEISYSEALSIKKISKNEDENIIKEALEYLKKKEEEKERPAARAFEKYLKEKYSYQDKNRGHKKSPFSFTKDKFLNLNEKKMENIEEGKKSEAEAILKEIEESLSKLEKLCE